MNLSTLNAIEKTGAAQLLVILLDADRHITELIRRTVDGPGISSQPALEKTRTRLLRAGLVQEAERYYELSGRSRVYIGLTPKGRRIAEHLKIIAEILSE